MLEQLTKEEKEFLEGYKNQPFHRFYELEIYAGILRKLRSNPEIS